MDDAQRQAVELALSQAKRVSRETRMLVQQLAQIRDHLQSEETKGTHDSNSSST